jgi:transcriptional regulator with XRE-family HTH domain
LPAKAREHLDEVERAVLAFYESGADSTALLEAASAAVRQAAVAVLADRVNGPGEAESRTVTTDEVRVARLKEHRAGAGWTQARLAEAMAQLGFQWSRQQVAEVEAGTRRVTDRELLGLAALYGVPVLAFLRPADDEWVEFPGVGSLDPGVVRELLSGEGGPDWEAARGVCLAPAGEEDWRPAPDLWKARQALGATKTTKTTKTTRRTK